MRMSGAILLSRICKCMHFKPSCDVIKAEEFSKETFTKTRQTNNNSKLHLQCIVSLASIALVELEIK